MNPRIPKACRKGRRAPAILAAAFLGVLACARGAESPAAPVHASAWWRALDVRGLDGRPLDPAARWFVVVFLSRECPVSNVSVPVLNRLAAEFAPGGVTFIGAYVDPDADLAELRTHAAEYGIGFPTADDRGQRLVRLAGATYTPEAFVFSADGTKLYAGRIDDRVGDFGAARPAATRQELRDVLVSLAAGSPGPFKGKMGYGCAISTAVRP
jgi:hypothetical protein